MNREELIGYEIYLQSFYDTNGDGIGDINGVTKKLDYIKSLGVNLLWITPFFSSPLKDNGYDVSNYYKINPIFGNMKDFDNLIREAKKRNIIIMIDLVFNHTSTEHKWFLEAKKGNKKYQNYYFFKKNLNNKPPTNWISKFGGSAWKYIPKIDKWYLHLFGENQADLNWENPNVREEIFEVVKFWMKKGVKGFRFDVINLISKPKKFLNSKSNDGKEFYTNGKNLHKYLKELNKRTFGKDKNIITIGETSSATIKDSTKISSPQEKELSMVFSFHHLKVDYANHQKWTLPDMRLEELKKILGNWTEKITSSGGWLSNFFSNHDQPRHVSRFGSNNKYHFESATAIFGTYLLLKGTPFIYNGEELGIKNIQRKSIDNFNDIETRNVSTYLQNRFKSSTKLLKILNYYSRDNARTFMFWDDKKINNGFSSGIPWFNLTEQELKMTHSVKQQENNKDSILNFYKKLIKFRMETNQIKYGSILFQNTNDSIISYERFDDNIIYRIVVNWSEKKINFKFNKNNIIVNNYKNIFNNYLLPYQFLIFKYEK